MPAGFDAATKKTVQGERSVDGILQAVGAGFTSGLVISVFMNPYDRALYLALKERRPFLRKENFRKPYKGHSRPCSSVCSAASTSCWRTSVDRPSLTLHRCGAGQDALAGQSAGIATGFASPLAFVSTDLGQRRAVALENHGQIPRSFPGFSYFRGSLDPPQGHDIRWSLATGRRWFTVSDPALKFCPTRQRLRRRCFESFQLRAGHAVRRRREEPDASLDLAAPRPLSGEARDPSAGDLRPQLLHLQSRLQIGWGTLRVTLGMSLSAAMYDA